MEKMGWQSGRRKTHPSVLVRVRNTLEEDVGAGDRAEVANVRRRRVLEVASGDGHVRLEVLLARLAVGRLELEELVGSADDRGCTDGRREHALGEVGEGSNSVPGRRKVKD
jgi:hypothetical protein